MQVVFATGLLGGQIKLCLLPPRLMQAECRSLVMEQIWKEECLSPPSRHVPAHRPSPRNESPHSASMEDGSAQAVDSAALRVRAGCEVARMQLLCVHGRREPGGTWFRERSPSAEARVSVMETSPRVTRQHRHAP